MENDNRVLAQRRDIANDILGTLPKSKIVTIPLVPINHDIALLELALNCHITSV